MAFDRYGLTNAPGREGGMPLQYTNDGKGGWSINCFACHGGKVAGQVIPGAPNTLFAMETLAEDVRATRRKLGQFSLRDLAAGIFPQGNNVGTTNAVSLAWCWKPPAIRTWNGFTTALPPSLFTTTWMHLRGG